MSWSPLSAFMQDLWFSLRMLARSRSFTIVASMTLALGIGTTTTVFGIVNRVLLRDLPYESADRLVMLWEHDPRRGVELERVTPADFVDWRAQNQVFENIAFSPAWPGSREFMLVGKQGTEKIPGAFVSSDFFAVLGAKPILGRTFSSDEDRFESNAVAILSYSLWQRRFGGDSRVTNQVVEIDTYGLRSYAIVGVMPPGFRFPDKAEIWLSAGRMGVRLPEPGSNQRCCPWFQVFGRLKPGITLVQAQRHMTTLARHIADQHPQGGISSDAKVVGLLDQMVGSLRPAMMMLLGAAGCVLLIACANVANLLLSRATSRQREFAVRMAVGATRSRLIQLLLTESLTLALLGSALGIALAAGGLHLVVAIAGDRLPRLEEIRTDVPMLVFATLLSVLSAIFVGVFPAWQASKTNLNQALNDAAQTSSETRHRRRLRSFLVASEIAVALVLLITAGSLLRSLSRLLHLDPGFRVDHVLTAKVDMTGSGYPGEDGRQAFFQRLMTQVKALPGVISVGGALAVPLSGGFNRNQPITLEGQPLESAADSPKVDDLAVTPDYFQTMGIPLLKGRSFSERDSRTSPMVAVINETMARQCWPGGEPVGRRLLLGSLERFPRNPDTGEPVWISVVGVVGDFRDTGLETAPRPQLFFSYRQFPWTEGQLVLRTSVPPLSLAPAIRQRAITTNRNALLTGFATMQQVVANSLAQPRFRTILLSIFSALALILAGVGVYSAMSYSVAQQTHEIGIRMAVGAQPWDVLILVLREGMILTIVGAGIGLLAAIVSARLLANTLSGLSTSDPTTLLLGTSFLVVVTMLACFVPAYGAATVVPMVALRYAQDGAARQTSLGSLFRNRAIYGITPPSGQANHNTRFIAEVGQAAQTVASVPELFKTVAAKIGDTLGASYVSLFIRDERSGDFVCAVSTSDLCAGGESFILSRNAFVVTRLKSLFSPLHVNEQDFETWERACANAEESIRQEVRKETDVLRRLQVAILTRITMKDEIIGILALRMGPESARSREEERDLLTAVANQLAFIIENARLATRIAQHELLQRELSLAAEVQCRLFPERAPEVPSLAMSGFCRPCRGIGGDYYDFLELEEHGRIGIVVADVAGKGIAAALLMSVVQASFRSLAPVVDSPSSLVSHLNRLLHRCTGNSSYATLFYAQYSPQTRILTYVNAGHNPPYLLKHGSAGPSLVNLPTGGTVIGLFGNQCYEQSAIRMEPGDLLVIYTDGLIEALNREEAEFGEAKLEAILLGSGEYCVGDVQEKVVSSVFAWIGDAPQYDDLTVVVVKVN